MAGLVGAGEPWARAISIKGIGILAGLDVQPSSYREPFEIHVFKILDADMMYSRCILTFSE
jgi:hypothetical protein